MGHQATVYDVIPAIFTLPEIGRVGVTEQQARERVQAAGQISQYHGGICWVGEGASDREYDGVVQGHSRVSNRRRILGVHIVGDHAADLVHEAALAMQVGATVTQMAEIIQSHPTREA